jgi:GNAT superfamily N-acetyltransferase
MDFRFLADSKKAIPILANWYFKEWGYLENGNTYDKVSEKLYGYLNINKMPLIIVAVEENEIIGSAQLKYREMDIYPKKEHWLGGVYVSKKYLGNRVAEKIVVKIISIARELEVNKLHLQTEDLRGGLYCHLGWQPVEQVNYRGLDVLVMEKQIG